MMFSVKTCLEIGVVIKELDQADVDTIFEVFGLQKELMTLGNVSRTKKMNFLLGYIKAPTIKGPFGKSFQMDMLQYLVDEFYRNKKHPKNSEFGYDDNDLAKYEDLFINAHLPLANSLKRDGYTIKGQAIKKLLPEEIEEAKIENELLELLGRFGLTKAKGHLEQAIENHGIENWAGANAQFRSFLESLLIEICKIILPGNVCESAGAAIKLLSSTANPPFLKVELNEVESTKGDKTYVEGLWKRLHPEGSHPGLSDEEDSTFRYHTVIVFAHYLLRRLARRRQK